MKKRIKVKKLIQKQNLKELFSGFTKEDFYSKVNLHIHSNNSDGSCDFDFLVQQAIDMGLKYIAITDHNTLNGHKNTKFKDNDILIKGIEFDCIYNTVLMHILGYGIDIDNSELNNLCAKNYQEQKNDLIRLFKMRHPKKVIEAIHSAGGIAVLAHPCCCNAINLEHLVRKLKSFGLDGIEVYYPYDRLRGIVKFSSSKLPYKLADKYSLIKTGGTDEHKDLTNHTI